VLDKRIVTSPQTTQMVPDWAQTELGE
jgi:hypothetical protein